MSKERCEFSTSDASIAGFFNEKTANAEIILNVQFYDKRNTGCKRAGERTLRKKKQFVGWAVGFGPRR